MVDMKISPLAVTRPDWEIYIKMVQETLGFSPSTGLGATYIKIESPAAYLATLDLENQPLAHLRRGNLVNSTFEHFSISFICSLEPELTHALLLRFSNLHFICKKGRKEFLVIVTATMADWYVAVRRGLDVAQDLDVREFFHTIFGLFALYGFQEVWTDSVKSLGKDGFTVMGAKYETAKTSKNP